MSFAEQCAKPCAVITPWRRAGLPVRVHFPHVVDDGEPGAVRPRLPDQRHGVPAARSRVLRLAAVAHGVGQEGRDRRASRLRPHLKTCACGSMPCTIGPLSTLARNDCWLRCELFGAGDYKPPVAEDEGPRCPGAECAEIRRSTSRQRQSPWSIRSARIALSLGWRRRTALRHWGNGIFDPDAVSSAF